MPSLGESVIDEVVGFASMSKCERGGLECSICFMMNRPILGVLLYMGIFKSL